MARFRYATLVIATLCACCSGGSEFGTYDGSVRTRWLDDSRAMEVLAQFSYTDPDGEVWVAPKGAIVDGASIPRWAWTAAGGPFTGRYRKASVIHDVACDAKEAPWEKVHEAFYWAMRASGVKDLRAKVMYGAVYHFGPRWPQEVQIAELSEEQVVDATQRVLAAAPPGSTAEIIDDRGVIIREREVLGHTQRTSSRLRVLRVSPPRTRIKTDDFTSLEQEIEQRQSAGGMTLEEIRSYRPQ